MTLLRALLIAALVSALPAVALVSAAGSATSVVAPPGDTIVDITGDVANGFEIRHYDGTSVYPPTDSEALAECREYDRRVARVRCRTEVLTWYHDLAATQQALDWAHESGTL